MRCSAGTYVRALARDLGEALGTGGHLVALRRTVSGPVRHGGRGGLGRDRARRAPIDAHGAPPARAARGHASTAAGLEALRHGRALDAATGGGRLSRGAAAGADAILDDAGNLLALAVPRGFEAPATPGLTLEPVLHPDIVLVD